ncbi:MAG: regulatory protein RecX [Bacteroidales bacterium]
MSEYEKAVAKAAKLCSSAEKCSRDVKEKLFAWGLNEAAAEKVISYLKKNNFLDDKRYAQFFVKDKLKFNKWGRVKIAYALRRKQLPAETIDHALKTIDRSEYEEILDRLITEKIRSAGEIKQAIVRAKILRFAAQRGFTSEEIYDSLKRIE